MKEYFSHYTAAFYWNIPYIDAVLGEGFENHRLGGEAVDITVSELNARYGRKNRTLHFCKANLSPNTIIKRGGIFISSPELLFLELAHCLSFHRLVLLGLQLCAHPPGKPTEAITTKTKLSSFLNNVTVYRGRKDAARALKYVENGSASLLESITFLICTLPHSLGGYGLTGATFNHEIILGEAAHKRLKQKRCFADIYFSKAKLAIEYDSFAFHNSPTEQAKDMLRSSALERQGIQVMHLSTIQLYDNKACDEFALNIASRLGQRMRIRATGFNEANQALRTLLPTDINL